MAKKIGMLDSWLAYFWICGLGLASWVVGYYGLKGIVWLFWRLT